MKNKKVSNWKFHSQIQNGVTALISEQFLELWLDHFPFANWQNVRYKQTSKQTNKQKIENFNFHNQITDHVTVQI